MPSSKGKLPLLVISAVDPSAGAGMYLDLAVARERGVLAMGVVTALTIQNANGLRELSAVETSFLTREIRAIEDQIGRPGVVKMGALGSAENARALFRWLRNYARSAKMPRVVLDPVRRPSRGKDSLVRGESFRKPFLELLGQVELLTPNLPEALWLVGRPEKNLPATEPEMIELGKAVLALGPRAVLLKGGHASGKGEIVDLLVHANGVERFPHRRECGEFHGTGCYLASAVAAGLCKGETLHQATKRAIRDLTKALPKAQAVGRTDVRQLLIP